MPCFSGFSLPEVAAALIILALVSSGVLTVYNRCIASATDSAQRYQAFWIARENMEALLSADSVTEMAEIGSSDKYPQIQWQTNVETFYEPITARMWVQAICSAEYTDTAGQVQTVELTHWLTDLTKKDVLEIIEQKQKEQEQLAEQAEQNEPDGPEPDDEVKPKPDTKNPLGLPDGYEDWPIDEIIGWLRDNGFF